MMKFKTIANPELDYDKVMRLYRQYCKKELAQGREPVSFRKFVTGQY